MPRIKRKGTSPAIQRDNTTDPRPSHIVTMVPSPTNRFRTLAGMLALGACLALAPQGLNAAKRAHKPAAQALPAPSGYERRPEALALIEELVEAEHFDRAALVHAFKDARRQSVIVAAMERPLLQPPKWFTYAVPFLDPDRVAAGARWWNEHAQALARAEELYGVPPEIVTAIVGIETFYGRHVGRYRVLDALATLAFDYPRRATFFRGELKEFLLLTRDLGVSPLVPLGSFAGAMGIPQFMPGSYRQFAVDFDADGRTDLWTDGDDVVGSVANFLVRHDWQRGQPILLPAALDEALRDRVLRRLDGGLSERRSLQAWLGDGVSPATPTAGLAPDPVGLLLLEEDVFERASYWIACNNFYVLTRYNRSRLYAAAVWHLAQAIKSARNDPAPR